MYKYDVNYLFEFILKQTDFILRTTKGVNTHNDSLSQKENNGRKL